MDLRDRGGADGDFIDSAEQCLDRRLESFFNRFLDRRKRRWRERILKPEEVGGGSLADEIGTRRERLAELDRGGTDRLQRGGIVGDFGLAESEARGAQQAADVGGGERIALDPLQRAVAGQRAAPAEKSPQMRDRVGQIFQPPWMATRPPRIGSTLVEAKPASSIIARNAAMRGERRIDSTR